MRQRQMNGQARAQACPVWAPHVLRARTGAFSLLVSQRGVAVGAKDMPELESFAMELTAQSMASGESAPAQQLVPIDPLHQVLAASEAGSLIPALTPLLEPFRLPAGPTHGDLHRDNFLKVGDQFRIIDCDRFRVRGCPLFDRLHFRLSEAQRDTGRSWLDTLLARQDIVDEIACRNVTSEALLLAYAMQRIAHEGEGAFLLKRSLRKYRDQAERLLAFSGRVRTVAHRNGEQE